MDNSAEADPAQAADRVAEARSGPANSLDPINLDFAPTESKPPVGWGEVEADPEITDTDMVAITEELTAFLARTGFKGRVSVKIMRKLINAATGTDQQGRYRRWISGRHEIHIAARSGAGPLGTLRHELIHALKAMGIFSDAEWKALVRAARRNEAIRTRIDRNYADLDPSGRDEEMVAELYRVWGETSATDAPVRLMERIRNFIQALGNALVGRGFHSAAATFRAIETGKAARREPVTGAGGTTAESRSPDPVADMERVATQVREVLDGKKPTQPIALLNTPVLRALTGKNVPVVIAPNVIWKANADKHGLTGEQIIEALRGLSTPVMVFDSATASDSLVALVDVPNEVRPIVAALHLNEMVGRIEVARVASIHAKDSTSVILRWMRQGYLCCLNKKMAGDWSRPRGLQLPKGGTTSHRHGLKILQHRDAFKNSGDAAGDALTRELRAFNRDPATTNAEYDRKERKLLSSLLTDAMGARGNWNLLALVRTRPLLEELGRNLPGARTFLRLKEEMDAERNKWHQEHGKRSNEWRRLLARNGAANRAMMDLMHEATLDGVDPAEDYVSGIREGDEDLAKRGHPVASKLAQERIDAEPGRNRQWTRLRTRFEALPPEFQQMWCEVRDSYTRMCR